MLGALKVIPMLLAFLDILNMLLDFFGIDSSVISLLGGVSFLPLVFLYLASYVFRFCEYHRMFLHYIVANNMLTYADYYIGIPVDAASLFADDGYEDELVLTRLYDIDAPLYVMQEVNRLMDSCKANCGFTYTNGYMKEAVVLIGPTTSGEEFIDTLVHEVHHLAVAIAYSVGVDLEGETPAYISGDSARGLADVVCHFGCPSCN